MSVVGVGDSNTLLRSMSGKKTTNAANRIDENMNEGENESGTVDAHI